MSYGQTMVPNILMEIRENEYNLQFSIGDKINFLFNEDHFFLSGTIVKKYTNSCLVDISKTIVLSEKELEFYNGKVVINYKKIEGVTCNERAQL